MKKRFLSPDELREAVEPFIGNYTGLVNVANELYKPSSHPDICAFTTSVSEAGQLYDHIFLDTSGDLDIAGSGSSTDRTIAEIKAYCEALERYCNTVYDPERIIVASANELGDSALDLTKFYQGTPESYRYVHPRNIVVPPNNDARIRWIDGVSLITGKPVYVPFSAIYISSPFEYGSESFTLPITTGTAMGASYEQALISGICEAVERDALTLVWLHQLPIPRIDVSNIRDAGFKDRVQRIERTGLRQYFFDATTDLGIPTIYGLQIDEKAEVAALVMSSTKSDPLSAIIRVMDESAPSRLAIGSWARLENQTFSIDDYRSFSRLQDGAIFYADPQNLHAFDFLMDHDNRIQFEDIPSLEKENVEDELALMVDRFRQQSLELVAVDLTIPQLKDVGLYVVKALSPQLMPLITNHNQPYAATPRLYDAPRCMGYPVRSADRLNPYPQPFA